MRAGYAPIPEPRPRLAWRSVATALLLGALAGVCARRADETAKAAAAGRKATRAPAITPATAAASPTFEPTTFVLVAAGAGCRGRRSRRAADAMPTLQQVTHPRGRAATIAGRR